MIYIDNKIVDTESGCVNTLSQPLPADYTSVVFDGGRGLWIAYSGDEPSEPVNDMTVDDQGRLVE